MNKYEKLLKKLNNNERIKLLFVSPDYTGIYPYSHVETNYFSKEKYECDVRLIKNENIEEIIRISEEYDCIVNLCDGYMDNKYDIPNTNFIRRLEENGIPYTGGNERSYLISKADLIGKVPTPQSIHYEEYERNNDIIKEVRYPLFIKPNNLGCSELIDNNSVVNNKEELDNQLNKIIERTRDIIIQEYINGSEYTALVFRNKNGEIICLDPIEITFTNDIKYLTNDIKVNSFDTVGYNFEIDEDKVEKIKEVCKYTYDKLNLNSYVRLDLRELYVIDVNAYPEIFGLEEEEDIADTIIRKFYDFDNFLLDMLYDSVYNYLLNKKIYKDMVEYERVRTNMKVHRNKKELIMCKV